MSVSRARFQLALRELKSSQWHEFELLCSAFLAAEFGSLRTMANPGGDLGRDAELYFPDSAPHFVFQYSVSSDWKAKVRSTARRLNQSMPGVTHLVYLTNQEIGAAGDPLRAEFLKNGRSVDIRDQNWFLERFNFDDARKNAAGDLAKLIVDPFLETRGIVSNAPNIGGQEARTALLYLEMQSKDDVAAKGLTKLSFEAMVRCALRGTSADSRKSRTQIHNLVNEMLPQHSAQQLQPFINSALIRLSKRAIKHYTREDEFHISFEESEITKNRVAEIAILNDDFSKDIREILVQDQKIDEQRYDQITLLVKNCIETYFYRSGEEFAQALTRNVIPPMNTSMMQNISIETAPVGHVYPEKKWIEFLSNLTQRILSAPTDATKEMLRLLSDSYTLFAFLSAVPDVQKATKKLFDRGEIWLDTSVVLPVLAESAFGEDVRPFSSLMRNLVRAGTRLYATAGIIEEVERHLNLCRTYVRSSEWRGRVPYVFSRYVESGRPIAAFPSWLETVVGDHRALDDISDFLSDVAGIEVNEPGNLLELDDAVVRAVRDYWQNVQERRRSEEGFSAAAFRLAEHDSENYLTAMAQRRKAPGASALGYSSWYLTMDSAAWRLFDNMDYEVRQMIQHPPLISLDFLLKYLAFGPRRDQVEDSEKNFSRIFTPTVYESIPSELIAVAEKVRAENTQLPERLIQRRIRDELDRQKMAAGVAQKAGLEDATSAFTRTL